VIEQKIYVWFDETKIKFRLKWRYFGGRKVVKIPKGVGIYFFCFIEANRQSPSLSPAKKNIWVSVIS